MATERSRSPLELPPRTSRTERPPPRTEVELPPPSAPVFSMPVSFGVLVLGMTVTCLLSLLLSSAVHRNASTRVEDASRASERRLAKELMQLKATTAELRTQLELREQETAAQSREIERLGTELKAVRARNGLDARSARLRRASVY